MAVMDLVQWLGAQLDEDERIARGATWHPDAGAWVAEQSEYGSKFKPQPRWFILDSMDDGVITDVDAQASEPEGVARHIVRHDPARVLREIDAKRQLLAEHTPGTPKGRPGMERHCLSCTTAQSWDEAAGQSYCRTLRLLALPYADRPGYREELRP